MADDNYAELEVWWRKAGIDYFKVMPDESLAGVKKQLFTYGIVSKLDWSSFEQRWCFENAQDARLALDLWDGIGDPSGPWLKTFHPERHNPNMFRQRPDCPAIWDRIPANDLNILRIWPA